MSKLFRDIETLKFDPANSRKHDERNIKAIMESLKQHGQRKPIVIYSDMVVAGNGTLEAAKRLGWTEIWINNDPFPSLEAAKAYALQDNRSAELAAWDDVQLGDTLSELKEAGYDLEGLGWNDGDLKEIMSDKSGTEGLTDPDELPEVAQNELGVKRGDIWKLGNHRLMCGDSTLKEDVEKLMNGEKPDMVFTDPPYNINYQGVKDKREKIINDKMNEEDFFKFLLKSIMPCDVMYVCCSWQFSNLFKQAMKELKKPAKAMIVWDKVNPAQHLDLYFKQHEIIFYHGPFGGKKTVRGDIWKLKRQKNTVHPTMKPVELIEIAIADHSESKLLYDSFCGSGSTLIACEKTGRKCYGMELDEHYCSVIIKRWQDFTGKKAERIVEGT